MFEVLLKAFLVFSVTLKFYAIITSVRHLIKIVRGRRHLFLILVVSREFVHGHDFYLPSVLDLKSNNILFSKKQFSCFYINLFWDIYFNVISYSKAWHYKTILCVFVHAVDVSSLTILLRKLHPEFLEIKYA